MIKVLITVERLGEHVVYVDYHGLAKLVTKHLIDKSMIGCTSIFYSKGYEFIAENASLSDECSLLLVVWMHKDLVVA